jgi:pyridoxamine 5'-phosphate oxidase
MAAVEEVKERYSETREDGTKVIPRPPHWGGFRVRPTSVEFWRSGGRSRLHDRIKYVRKHVDGVFSEWSIERLAP